VKAKVNKIIRTCSACPSQWEGTLSDGRMIYIRYRWGFLTVSVSDGPTNSIDDAVKGYKIYSEQIGDPLDGILGYGKLKGIISDFVDLPGEENLSIL